MASCEIKPASEEWRAAAKLNCWRPSLRYFKAVGTGVEIGSRNSAMHSEQAAHRLQIAHHADVGVVKDSGSANKEI